MFADTVYPYTRSQFHTGLFAFHNIRVRDRYVDLSSPLVPDGALAVITPISFALSDGYDTFIGHNRTDSAALYSPAALFSS